MLILSRKSQEIIVINDNIRIIVVGIEKNKVRLGIEAPADVKIDRLEIKILKDKSKDDRT